MCIFAHGKIYLNAKTFEFICGLYDTHASEKKNPLISLGINKLEPSLGLSVVENLLLGLLLTLTGTP